MYERVLRRRFLELEDRGIDPFSVRTATFGDLAARWMKEHVEVRNRASTRRAKTFALRLHLLPTLQDIPSHKVTSKDIDRVVRLMSEQKLSGKTINNNLSMLRTCLSWGQRRGLVDRVPETPGMPVTEPRYSFLSPDEARQLIAATNSQYWKTLLLFLLHTGCRIGEASALEWSAVELDGPAPRIRILQTTSLGVVGPTKNGRHREIPLSAELLGALRTLPHGSRYVFGLNDGSLLQSTQSAKRLHRICRRAGLKRVSWHALRHTFATELSTRRVPLRAIQELLGHASLAMTARYAHVTDGALQTAVATLPAYSSEV